MAGFEVPKSQNAAVRTGKGQTARAPTQQIEVQLPGPTEILVKITWTGLCSSDGALIHGGWKEMGVDMALETKGIAGHEGVGIVVAIGDAMHHKWKVGDRAGIKWIWSVCGECEFCLNGADEVHCLNQKNSGVTVPGTFQEYAVSDGKYASKIPDDVKDEEAGPIMCGGVTAYAACKRSGVRPGQWVVFPGAGGGVGHFGVQYARAMGMRVIAVDGSDEKGDLCKQLGAEHFINFHKSQDIAAEVKRITTYGAHGVIVTAASKSAYATAPSLLRPNGTLVSVGLPHDASVIAGAPPLTMVLNRLKVVGSVVGSLKEVEEALDFTARGLVHPILHKGTLEDVDNFLAMMDNGKLIGRAVLKVTDE